MALGPAASTPVQHPTQHAVKNPSHLPAALAPNTPSPSPHTTRSWCEITGQDQASAHQVKRRCRRGIRYEQPSCDKSPLFITDIFVCHVRHRRISCRDWTDSKYIWTVPERWSAPPGKRLQATALALRCSERRPNAAVNVTVQRGRSRPTGVEMNGDRIATRDWCVTVGHEAQLPSALPRNCFKCPHNHLLRRTLSLLLTTTFPRLLSFSKISLQAHL